MAELVLPLVADPALSHEAHTSLGGVLLCPPPRKRQEARPAQVPVRCRALPRLQTRHLPAGAPTFPNFIFCSFRYLGPACASERLSSVLDMVSLPHMHIIHPEVPGTVIFR